MCYDPIDLSEPNGKCQECDTPTVDGEAAEGCGYSRVGCEKCGWQPCDLSC